jgi:hypothetical protein
MNLSIRFADRLSPALRDFTARISGPGAVEMNRAAGFEVQQLTTRHLRDIAGSRHETATKLGAAPTNHWAQAAEKVASPAALTADSDSAVLAINHPGIGRAFHDVTITPTNAKALTIPVSAIAYGRRAGEFGRALFIFKSKFTGTAFLAMRQGDRNALPLLLYVLLRSVTQRQDRSLLPSDDELGNAAAEGVKRYVRMALTKGGNL